MDERGCPLCGEMRTTRFHADGQRGYSRCPSCDLVFVPPEFHLTPDEERRRYDLHENSPDDPRYREFLGRLIRPLAATLIPNSRGIDFGAGPGPALSLLMRERGFEIEDYDPFYSDDRSLLEREYDFVASSETVEHFCRPAESWELMMGLVRPGGILAIMTEIREKGMDFSKWHYIRDDTHVAFYSRETFEWIARHFGSTVEFHGRSVVIFRAR